MGSFGGFSASPTASLIDTSQSRKRRERRKEETKAFAGEQIEKQREARKEQGDVRRRAQLSGFPSILSYQSGRLAEPTVGRRRLSI